VAIKRHVDSLFTFQHAMIDQHEGHRVEIIRDGTPEVLIAMPARRDIQEHSYLQTRILSSIFMVGRIHSTPKDQLFSPSLQLFPSAHNLHVSIVEHKVVYKMSPDTGDRYGGQACPLVHSPIILDIRRPLTQGTIMLNNT